MNERTKLFSKHFIKCPFCGKEEFAIEHLLKKAEEDSEKTQSFGPWYCDHCSLGFKGVVKNRVVTITAVTETDKKMGKCITMLSYRGLHIFIRDTYLGEFSKSDLEYLHNEHNCPSNYFTHAEELVFEVGKYSFESDPHGVFEFVDSIPYDDEKTIESIIEQLKIRNLDILPG